MIATEIEIRAEGGLDESVDDKDLTPALKKASIEIKRLLGPDLYAEIEAEAETPDKTKQERYSECQTAEANLAMSYAVTTLNIETQGKGIVRSKGWDESRSDLLRIDETTSLGEYFRNIAMNLLQPYLPVDEGSPDTTEDDNMTFRGGNFTLSAI